MEMLTSNVEKLTGSISEGFGLLRQIMLQPYGGAPQYLPLQANNNYHQNMYNGHPNPTGNPVAVHTIHECNARSEQGTIILYTVPLLI